MLLHCDSSTREKTEKIVLGSATMSLVYQAKESDFYFVDHGEAAKGCT